MAVSSQTPLRVRLLRWIFASGLVLVAFVALTLAFPLQHGGGPQRPRFRALDDLDIVAAGLDPYHLKHGRYPDLPDFPSMVAEGSCLVTENLIPVHVPSRDPWGHAYSGQSTSKGYRLLCDGDGKVPATRPERHSDMP